MSVVELDNNGRFLIPKHMLAHANLEKDVIVVGMGNRIELWSPDLYSDQIYPNREELSDTVQKFLDSE